VICGSVNKSGLRGVLLIVSWRHFTFYINIEIQRAWKPPSHNVLQRVAL